jgi:hypothetical protein
MNFDKLERGRVRSGPFGTRSGDDWGAFFIALRPGAQPLKIICSPMTDNETGWQHVSVSHPSRCPTWEEMCSLKDLFWEPEQVVVQFHPRASEYVNNVRYCLHMWRWLGGEFPTPPMILVGDKTLGVIS